MVECISLNSVFQALSDETRRDILRRVSSQSLSISALSSCYRMSFAAVSKHVKLLEAAGLVHKVRHGKEQQVSIEPHTVEAAEAHLSSYEELWRTRLDTLDHLLNS